MIIIADNKLTVEIRVRAEQAMNTIKNFKNQLNLTNTTTNSTNSYINTLNNTLSQLGSTVSPLTNEFNNFVRTIETLVYGGSFYQGLTADAEALSKDQSALNALLTEYGTELTSLVNEYNRLSAAADAYNKVLGDIAFNADAIFREGDATTYEEAYRMSTEMMSNELDIARQKYGQYGRSLEEVNEKILENIGSQKDIKTQLTDTNKVLEDTNVLLDAEHAKVSKIIKIGANVIGVLAEILIAIKAIKALWNLSSEMSELGDEIEDTSAKMQMSYIEYQRWEYIMNICGSSISSLKTAVRGMNKYLASSDNSALKAIGFTDKDIAELKSGDTEDALMRIVKQLQNVKNNMTELELATVSKDIFGSRAYAEMLGVIEMGNEDLEEIINTYDRIGKKSATFVDLSAQFQDVMYTLKVACKSLAATIAETLLPIMIKLAKWAIVCVYAIKQFLRVLFGLGPEIDGASDSANSFSSGIGDSLDDATSSAKALKRELMGFDEINKLSDDSSGSIVGSGIDLSDLDALSAFKGWEVLDGIQDKLDKIDNFFSKYEDDVKIASLAIMEGLGALLIVVGAYTGNIPLILAGIGMMGAGVAIAANNGTYSALGDKLGEIFDDLGNCAISMIAGAIAVGLGVMFCAAGMWGIGLSMIVLGAAAIVTPLTVNWDGITGKISELLSSTGGIVTAELVGAAAVGIGILLCCTGHWGLGLGAIVLGAASMISPIVANWDTISSKIEENLGLIELIASGFALALGLILCLTGTMLPVGIALIVLGAVNLVTQVAPNWDTVPTKVKTVLGAIAMVAGGFMFVIGLLLAITGAGLPLGLGLMAAGAGAFYGGSKMANINWDGLKTKLSNALESMKTTASTKLAELKSKFTSWSASIKTPHIKWVEGGASATGALKKVLDYLNLPTSLPKLSVSWYATGGITNGATIAGVGENGKEAILPLENNTEWMDKLASRLAKNIGGNQDIIVNVDGKQLFDIVVARNNQTVNMLGASPLVI